MAKSINRICNCLLFVRYPRLVRFLNMTPVRFSRTRVCLEHAQHNYTAWAIVSFELSRMSRKSMAISHMFPFVSSMLSYHIVRDMQESYLCPPFNLPRSIRGDVCRGNRTRKKQFWEFSWFFKRGTVVDRSRGFSFAINISDRLNKRSNSHRHTVTLYSQHASVFLVTSARKHNGSAMNSRLHRKHDFTSMVIGLSFANLMRFLIWPCIRHSEKIFENSSHNLFDFMILRFCISNAAMNRKIKFQEIKLG